MKIVAVVSWTESLELTQPYTIAFTTIEDTTIQALRIETDTGVVGIGTGTPFPGLTGESAEDCARALLPESLAWLIGRSPFEWRALCRENARRNARLPAARAALDIALHDLCARALNMPLAQLLGRVHHALPTSVTIGIMPLEETLAAAGEYLKQGFRALKIKIGNDLQEDIARLRKLREQVGSSVALRADANQGYTLVELKTLLEATDGLDLEILEQPLAPADFWAMGEFSEKYRRRVAADESLMTDADSIRLVYPVKLCGIFNIKLMKCGGITSALRIADIAEMAGVDLMWGCMDESRVSITAALHAALACPATRYLDLDGSLDLARDLAEGGFVLKDGTMSISGAPGLGVMLLPRNQESVAG